MRRVNIKNILANPEQRRALMVDTIIATQAREGIDTTREQAETAYDRVQQEREITTMLTLYARHEPTTDAVLLERAKPGTLTNTHRDVILYHDKEATRQAAIIPWHYNLSKPRRNQKTINHNCARYNLEWLDPTVDYSKPTVPNVTTVLCVKGSTYHGMVKRRVYPVVSTQLRDDYTVALTVQLTDRRKTFTVRHPNRLNDADFNAHTGDPTKTVRLSVHSIDGKVKGN